MILYWWIYVIIHLSKSAEYARPRVNHNETMYFGWLWCINVDSSTIKNITLVGGVNNGGSYPCVGTGVRWEISVTTHPSILLWIFSYSKKKSLIKKYKWERSWLIEPVGTGSRAQGKNEALKKELSTKTRRDKDTYLALMWTSLLQWDHNDRFMLWF